MKSIKTLFASLVGSVTILLAAPSLAGGPLAVCESGVPYLWANGGTNITFNPDQGNLGPVMSGDAVALVGSAFQAWEDIPSSTLSYTAGALLPVDVDITNFGPYLEAPGPDGLSAVVFDDTGEIFDLLYGPGSGILGFAGPEFGDPATCTIDEGLSFLNGPSFSDSTAALDVMVHEFGHWTNFAHTVVNGQVYLGSVGGDNTGPTPTDTFGAPPNPFSDVIETMYPFYYGPGIGTQTLEADDIAIASRMYPESGYASTTGEISGKILLGNSGHTGVNVIARNIVDPFNDAVSAISSDFTDSTDPSDPNVGLYRITGLTPGAEYGVYIDEVLAGGFSTALATPLPGPEELYNGPDESNDPNTDLPEAFTPVLVAAGVPNTGINILFNQPREGDPLPVGDDGSVQLSLPFEFCIRGAAYDSVFVNANGNLTFGEGNNDWSESVSEFLSGPPMIAGLWHDLQPVDLAGNPQGSVFFTTTSRSFTVTWENVPEWDFPIGAGSNTFDITLYDNSESCIHDDDDDDDDRRGYRGHRDDDSDDDYDDDRGHGADIRITHYAGDLTDAIVGFSGGLATTSGVEVESDLSVESRDFRKKIDARRDAAIFEDYTRDDGSFDLWGNSIRLKKLGKAFRDRFERNDSLRRASKIAIPFDTRDTKRRYSAIDPAAADIDFYRFTAEAGKYLIADVARGQIDSVLGLYYCPPKLDDDDDDDDDHSRRHSGVKLDKCDATTAILFAVNDDSNGLLSRIEGTLPITGTYALAVTFYGDLDFDGVDPGQGLPFDQGRYVLDVQLHDGLPLALGDETSVNLSGFGFTFPYDGVEYADVFVNSNGHITLGAAPAFGDFIVDLFGFENGPARVAPLWADLDASGALVLADTDFSTELTISFIDVPEWGFPTNVGANNFSVTLRSDGTVDFNYGSVTAAGSIVGTALGAGAFSTPVDLSTMGGGAISTSPVEDFTLGSPFDLGDGDTLIFTPD